MHNGEINTIRGNVDTMLAREETISSKFLKDDMTKVLPIVNQGGSDSAMLDNTLEFLLMNGMELSEPLWSTTGRTLSMSSTITAEDMDSSRASIRSTLPRIVLISPL